MEGPTQELQNDQFAAVTAERDELRQQLDLVSTKAGLFVAQHKAELADKANENAILAQRFAESAQRTTDLQQKLEEAIGARYVLAQQGADREATLQGQIDSLTSRLAAGAVDVQELRALLDAAQQQAAEGATREADLRRQLNTMHAEAIAAANELKGDAPTSAP